MHWLLYLLLLIVQIGGLMLNVLGLPGLWLMVGATGLFAYVTQDASYLGWRSVLVLAGLALVAEIAEFVSGSAGAKKAGGSKRAMIGGIVGALIGALVLSIPIPILGTIIGACVGAFAGAMAVELWVRKEISQSIRVGTGAAKGRFIGIIIKLCFGIVILILSAILCMPILWTSTSAAPPAATTQAVQ